MKAMILAAGQGSRLRPITMTTPKPMIRLLGKPIMESIVEHLRAQGVDVRHLIDAQMDPIDDYRGSLAYRRAMAGVLARRELETAWKMANKNPGS